MKKIRRFITIALTLALVSMVALSMHVGAQAPIEIDPFPICILSATKVGVGQQITIVAGTPRQTAWPQPGWEGVKVIVEKPGGGTEVLGPKTTYTTGIAYFTYTPTVEGTYYFQTDFPEQFMTAPCEGLPAGTKVKAGKSAKVALIVTSEDHPTFPGFPLPQEYWSRPIDAQLREWAWVAGNWLNVVSYTRIVPGNLDAPEAPHMLWQRPLDEGGLIGAIATGGPGRECFGWEDISYEHGDAYEGKWVNPVVINGILYYNRFVAQDTTTNRAVAGSGLAFNYSTILQEVVAVDIHTGEQLWTKTLGDNERLAFGQTFYWATQNMFGAFSYLWTTTTVAGVTYYKAYDPTSGRWEFSIANVPSGVRVLGPMGEILIYTVNTARGWMTLWNSTRAIWQTFIEYWRDVVKSSAYIYYANRWRPQGLTFNGTKGYEWNVTIPKLPGDVKIVLEDRILGSNTQWSGGAIVPNPVFWAISIKNGEEGRLIFNVSWTLPYPYVFVNIAGTGLGMMSHAASVKDGVFIVGIRETRQYVAFDINTGSQLWITDPEPDAACYTMLYPDPWGHVMIYNSTLYTAGMSGVVSAYNIKTGKLKWRYNITDPYMETPWGNWPAPIVFIADGKLYIAHQEHSADTPLARGAPTLCLDAATGQEIWRVNGLRIGTRWGGQPIIADSTILGFSSYDNTVVAIGKGPSTVTVEAPSVGVSVGSSIVIRGKVLDISPGTKDPKIALRFPDGVPAVADESMADWMLYVYKQHPRPANIKGVWVKIDAINVYTNEVLDLGGTNTDEAGFYTIAWTPPKEGLYKILATFPGSKSYYPSFAQTSIAVTGAPAAAPAYTTMDLTIIAAVIITIIICIAILYMVKKK